MTKSSSLAFGAKTYYRPMEAAIRWCGLLRFEQRILQTLRQRAMPEPGEFPRWPLLRLYADRIFDALTHGELAGGRDGIVMDGQRPALDDPQLTVRHVDLKAWMTHYYPGERPGFLFDEIERAVHPLVSVDTLNILLADREAAKVQLAELLQVHEALRAAHEAARRCQRHLARAGTAQRNDLSQHHRRAADAAAGQVALGRGLFVVPQPGCRGERTACTPRGPAGPERTHLVEQARAGAPPPRSVALTCVLGPALQLQSRLLQLQ